jgi:hypothetical protein
VRPDKVLGAKSLGGSGEPKNVGAARNGSEPILRAEGVAGTLGRSSDSNTASTTSAVGSTPLSWRPRPSSPLSRPVSASTLLTGNAAAGWEDGRSRWLGAGGGGDEGREDVPSLESEDFLDRPLPGSREDLGMANNFPGAAESKLTTAARPDHEAPVDFLAGKFPRRGRFDH